MHDHDGGTEKKKDELYLKLMEKVLRSLDNIQISQNEVKRSQDEVKNEVKRSLMDVSSRLEELEQRSYHPFGSYKVSVTATSLGDTIMDSLTATKSFNRAVEGSGHQAISDDLILEAQNMFKMNPRPHENILVNLYTPSLMEIVNNVSPDLRLVNSESNAWLQCTNKSCHNLKPDLFTAHHYLVHFGAPAYKNAPECTTARLFGKFSDWQCRASIHCIWEAKWKIDISAFGEICSYLQIAGDGYKQGVSLKLKGVLFDSEEFWMIKSSGSSIVDVVTCKWSLKGSMNLLENFLRIVDPWSEAADALCKELNVTIVDLTATTQGQSALLGAGANGRVFMLTNEQVLKIVVGKSSHEVEKEYKLMVQCLERAEVNPFVFPIVQGSFREGLAGEVPYAGYLLERKGEKVTLPVSRAVMTELVALLYELHSKNIIHGDPRIDNVLRLGSQLKWIDFRQCETVTTAISIYRDVMIFLKSVGYTLVDTEINYANDPTLEKLTAIVDKLKTVDA